MTFAVLRKLLPHGTLRRLPSLALAVLPVLALTLPSPSSAGDLQIASRLEFPSLSGILATSFSAETLDASVDGRFVVFASPEALATGDGNNDVDVYLYDRDTDRVQLVSRVLASGGGSGNGASTAPRISADGSTVVFQSEATDLVSSPVDSNGVEDVFLWDRATGQTTLVSRNSAGTDAGDGASESPRVSADGARVSFDSFATDLTLDVDANGTMDVFLWQRTGDQMILVTESATTPGTTANGGGIQNGLSDDGDAVLVESASLDFLAGFVDRNFEGPDLFHWRASSGTVHLVTQTTFGATTGPRDHVRGSALSTDGHSVTFVHLDEDLIPGFINGGNSINLFQWQESTGDTFLISHAAESSTTGGNGSSDRFTASADGAYVAYSSFASNLLEVDSNPLGDVLRWNRATGSNELVSREALVPLPANGSSFAPKISRDGMTIAFSSEATNLVNGYVPSGDPAFANRQIFVWRPATPIVLASRSSAGATRAADTAIFTSFMSGDGSEVYLAGDEVSTLVPGVIGGIFRFELASESVDLLSAVFKPTSVGVAFDGRADSLAISDDGRFVVFETSELGLVEGFVKHPETLEDVFLWDRLTGEVTLVSRSVTGSNIGVNETSQQPKISGDGNLVLFFSRGTDLIPGYIPPTGLSFDPNQLYAWHRETGEITLVSRQAGSPSTGANASQGERFEISSDGSLVVFVSDATDLVAGITDANSSPDLFTWDPATDTVDLITEGPAGSTANGFSTSPGVSVDGEFVVFRSGASDLVPGVSDTNGRTDAFVWQRSTAEITLVSHIAGDPSTAGARGTDDVDISGDGSTVSFSSSGSDLVPGVDPAGWLNVYVWDRQTRVTRWVTQSLLTPGVGGDGDSVRSQLSFDGDSLAFLSRRTDLSTETIPPGAQDQLFHWDAAADQITLITRSVQNPGSSGTGRAENVSISDDGQRVSFRSRDLELLSVAAGEFDNRVFLWDRFVGDLILITNDVEDSSLPANDAAEKPVLSRDGSSVAFISTATNLVSGTVPSARHVHLWRAETAVDLGASIVAPGLPVPTGQPVSYQLEVENLSGNPSTHTMAVLTLPAGSSFLKADGIDWDCLSLGRLLSCRRNGALAPAEISTLEIRMTAPQVAGQDCVHAAVIWPGRDADLNNNVVEVCTDFAPDDWGDAPDPSFPTLAASGGASHGFSSLFLGFIVDVDVDGQPNAAADGDETDGSADDDGVSFTDSIVVGQSAEVEVIASQAGLLDAYFDWNFDGDWQDAGEKVFDGVAIDAGSNTVALAVPPTALRGPTFARFRLSTSGTAGPGGRAPDGEVEDYALAVETIGLTVSAAASPILVPEVGTDVIFSVRVDNVGSQSAELSSLSDDLAGALDGVGTCSLPQTVDAGGFYACAYTLNLSGPVDATETHVVSASGASLGFDVQAQSPVTVTFFDSIPPAVLGFANSPEGPLVDCDTVQTAATSLSVTFSEQLLAGPTGGDDPASYLLVSTGPDLSFETFGCGPPAASDESVAFEPVYTPGADRFDPSEAVLSFSGTLNSGLYRLFACGALVDLADNALAGGDARLDFRVDPGNLFDNGHFDCDVRDWRAEGAGVEHDPTDVDGSPQSGSVAIAGAGGLSFGLEQCVSVAAESELTFAASLRLDGGPDPAVGLARYCAFFSDSECNDFVDESLQLELLVDTEGLFSPRRFTSTVPAGATGAACGFAVESPSGAAWELFFDAASLRIDAAIFSDGFESGDLAGWDKFLP